MAELDLILQHRTPPTSGICFDILLLDSSNGSSVLSGHADTFFVVPGSRTHSITGIPYSLDRVDRPQRQCIVCALNGQKNTTKSTKKSRTRTDHYCIGCMLPMHVKCYATRVHGGADALDGAAEINRARSSLERALHRARPDRMLFIIIILY